MTRNLSTIRLPERPIPAHCTGAHAMIRARAALHLSISAFALRAGVTKRTASRWQTGDALFSPDHIRDLELRLEVTRHWVDLIHARLASRGEEMGRAA